MTRIPLDEKQRTAAHQAAGVARDGTCHDNQTFSAPSEEETRLRPRVETTIIIVEETTGVEVPLGYRQDGNWVPCRFVSPVGNLQLLMFWEAWKVMCGHYLECGREKADSLLHETMEHCTALARAARERSKESP